MTLSEMNKELFNNELIIFIPTEFNTEQICFDSSVIGIRIPGIGAYIFAEFNEDLQLHDPMRQDAFIKMILPGLKNWYIKVKEDIEKRNK